MHLHLIPCRTSGSRRRLVSAHGITAIFLMLLPWLGGCVALNIPSERRHDARDDGGWLGGWHKPKRLGVPDFGEPILGNFAATESTSLPPGEFVQDGVAVTESCFGPSTPIYDPAAEEARQRESEVPWPRFHPVPTRPVFGTPQESVDWNGS